MLNSLREVLHKTGKFSPQGGKAQESWSKSGPDSGLTSSLQVQPHRGRGQCGAVGGVSGNKASLLPESCRIKAPPARLLHGCQTDSGPT